REMPHRQVVGHAPHDTGGLTVTAGSARV
ncbi:MAG: hypothetical protein QOI43_2718, partial [Gaiellales bacterium]|nr:hypothetical protein [Gaiellales bacterium]